MDTGHPSCFLERACHGEVLLNYMLSHGSWPTMEGVWFPLVLLRHHLQGSAGLLFELRAT